MPTYCYRCEAGHDFTRFTTVSEHSPLAQCPCGVWGSQIITAPQMVKVAQDVCYDSPITGAPITSHAARIEDMKRHDCVEYDPEMKTDARRRADESQAAFERTIEESVAHDIARLPSAKKQQLISEVVHQGLTPEPVRSTPC